MPLRLLYVMDPLARVLVDKDTTFAFLLEGERRGHEQRQCGVADLFLEQSVPHARTRRVHVRRAAIHYTLSDERSFPLGTFDVVFMRKDPPFDLSYYFATQVLGLADPAVTLVVNDPRGLREANEKLYALHFPELIPESLVSADPARLKAFMDRPRGAIRGVPQEDGARGNIHVGGRVERAAGDARDREICRRMAPRLEADGLYFVGLDIIGGLVTEVNVTSPTGVQEIDRLDGACL